MCRSGTATIVAAMCLVLVVGLSGPPAMAQTSYDGKWQGTYEIVKDYGSFGCDGGDVSMDIHGSSVAIETRNNRSSWTFQGAIDADGKLSASGEISTDFADPSLGKTITAEWSGNAAGDAISGDLNILKYCDSSWRVRRLPQ